MLVAVCLGSDGVGLEDALLELKWVASSFNIHVPTRNLFRHGNFNDFHLYHTYRFGRHCEFEVAGDIAVAAISTAAC